MFRKPLDIDSCPTSDELEAHARQKLYGKRNEEIFHHLKHCAKCLRRMATLHRVPSASEIIQGGQRPSWWQRLKGWRPFRRR